MVDALVQISRTHAITSSCEVHSARKKTGLAESLGSDPMHDSWRDSLRDSFFDAGWAARASVASSTCAVRRSILENVKEVVFFVYKN